MRYSAWYGANGYAENVLVGGGKRKRKHGRRIRANILRRMLFYSALRANNQSTTAFLTVQARDTAGTRRLMA